MSAKLDPRSKMILVLCLTTAALIISNLYFVLGLGAVSILTATALGINFWELIRRFRRIVILLFTISLIQSIFTPDAHVLLQVFGVRLLTQKGLMLGVKTFVRMLVILVSGVIMSTSNYREAIAGLVQWKMPYTLAFMVSLSLRFIPVFMEEFNDSLTALQLRGINIKKIPLRQKARVYLYLFTPIMLSVLKRSEELAIAMESRAFGAYPTRVEYLVLKLNPYDYAVMTGSFLFAFAYTALSFII